MRTFELFAGSRSFSRVAESLGHQVFTSDGFVTQGIDYVVNIRRFDVERVPYVPDVIWASPPCTGFSVAAIGKNWRKVNDVFIPLTTSAQDGIGFVKITLDIIQHFTKKNPNLIWFIENPRGVLRKMPMMRDFLRHTVTYCQYGDERMKPTDLWTNTLLWYPRPMCKPGDSCHVAAPRGSRTGTQGIKGAYDRGKVPAALCCEILGSLTD